jgi:polar amino acid transport system substrate-binding protein
MTVTVAHAQETVFDRVMKTKTLNCGYIIAPPYVGKDVNTGKMSGINYDMVEAVGRNLGLKINWKSEVGAGDVAAALSSNKIDVMCQTLWPSAARYSGMTFTNRPQFYSAIYAVARADDHRFDGDLSKANNKSIKAVGVEGDFSADMINEKFPDAQHVYLAGSAGLSDYIMQLTTKKADILFMDKGTIADYSKNNPDLIKIIPNLPAARIFGEHLTVKSGEYKLRDMLDMANLQLINDGTFGMLVDKYKKEYHTDIYAAQSEIKK